MHKITIRTVLAIILGLALSACDLLPNTSHFQVVSSPSGDLYRIQVSNGAMHKVVGAALIRVVETDRVELQVGAVYVNEDGNAMKYLGAGKFEPFKSEVLTPEEYLKLHGSKK